MCPGGQMADILLYREFWSDVLKRISRRTRGQADSEDLLQAAFVRFEQYRKDHQVNNPAGFLVRTAVNIWVDNHRHDKHSRAYVAEMGHEGQNFAPLQDEVIAARARLTRAKLGLEQLPPRTREIFLMHRLDELKYHEIATRLGISTSAVEKHIARASLFLTRWVEGW